MKRAVIVVTTGLVVVACSSFGTESAAPDVKDAGSEATSSGSSSDATTTASVDGSDTTDGAPASFCDKTIACDRFDDAALTGWAPYGGDQYQAVVKGGSLAANLPSTPASPNNNSDAARITRKLPADTSMRIEFDLTFTQPANYNGSNNVQLFSISSGSGATLEYIGLFAGNDNPDNAHLVLTHRHASGGIDNVDTGTLPNNQTAHITIDVHFSANGGVRMIGLGAKGTVFQFATSDATQAFLMLGTARFNGGTDALRASYDNFRVTEITDF